MRPSHAGAGLTLLDACAVINLYATRRMDEILRVLPTRCGIVDAVRREAGHVRRGGDAGDANELEPIALDALVEAGLLVRVSPTEAELEAFVRLTVQLDDGEAMTMAVALARGATVATDEKKAIAVLAGRRPVVSSLALVKTWADAVGLDTPSLGTVLRDLRQRGRYTPANSHPLKGWWDAAIGT